MIVADNLQKSYGRKVVLRGMSFRIEPGELALLVGSNGAGKSTTMKILAGLACADGGSALICGHDINSARLDAQRAFSYFPQNPQFHPRLSCLDILKFYARLRGISTDRCAPALDQVGLTAAARERTGALSGGMRQRLGLALLLLMHAPVLLLDEPGLSLDPGWRTRLQEILRAEAANGRAILVTTHLIAEWNGIADRCLLCRDGRIEREIDPNNLPGNFDDQTVPCATAPTSGALKEMHERCVATAL
jgi:ABC-type multidrug transport system ATPase subunit